MKTKKRKSLDYKIPVSDWEMFGIRVFGGGKTEVLKKAEGWLLAGEKKKWIATVNPEFVMRAVNDSGFMEILGKTDLNVADGIGLIWAKKVLKSKGLFPGLRAGVDVLRGKYRGQLVPGADLMVEMCGLKKDLKIFFLGGWKDRAKRTAESIEL